MALQIPLDDVRLAFTEILEELRAQGVIIPELYDPTSDHPSEYGPSSFVAPNRLPGKTEEIRHHLQDIYFSKVRPPHFLSLSLSLSISPSDTISAILASPFFLECILFLSFLFCSPFLSPLGPSIPPGQTDVMLPLLWQKVSLCRGHTHDWWWPPPSVLEALHRHSGDLFSSFHFVCLFVCLFVCVCPR